LPYEWGGSWRWLKLLSPSAKSLGFDYGHSQMQSFESCHLSQPVRSLLGNM
jgi:hypothetical protein